MSANNFRIGLVFTPTSLVSVGVLNSNQKEAYAFMEKIQPLINHFMEDVRRAAVREGGQTGQIRLLSSETKKVPER
jgi:hypothetical protein